MSDGQIYSPHLSGQIELNYSNGHVAARRSQKSVFKPSQVEKQNQNNDYMSLMQSNHVQPPSKTMSAKDKAPPVSKPFVQGKKIHSQDRSLNRASQEKKYSIAVENLIEEERASSNNSTQFNDQ